MVSNHKRIVTAGGAAFCVRSRDSRLLDTTASVFERGSEASPIKLTIDLDDQPARQSFEQSVAESIYITTHAILASFSDHLFVEGVAAVRSDGARILILGTGYRGKTTLAVAGAISSVWKIVSEDTVVLAKNDDMILSFIMPMALRPGSIELIEDAAGKNVNLNYGRWVVDRDLFFGDDVRASFDIAVVLQETSRTDSAFEYNRCSKEGFVRASIEYGNVLQTDSADRLYSSLANAHCYFYRNGTVSQRLHQLHNPDVP
jgi:hypothetical protein